ncbi:unnamed protein product [Withania somnifera]
MEDLKEKSEAITSSSILDVENIEEKPVMIRWKSGKKVDPRLIMLLNFFRDLYMKRGEFFKKVFPFHHEDFIPIFKKIGVVFSNNKEYQEKKFKIDSLKRSQSDNSLNKSRGIDESRLKLKKFNVKTSKAQSGGDEMRHERFKIKTPPVVIATTRPNGQGGHNDQDNSSSNNSG